MWNRLRWIESYYATDRADNERYYLYHSAAPDPCERALEVPKSNAGHVAQLSRDTALTAFAQLGAFRLNARRAMISLFDRTQQHILAEATKTLSFHSGLARDNEDSLLFGVTTIQRDYGVCTHVSDLPQTPAKRSEGIEETNASCKRALVVSDLKADLRFRETGFVKDNPQARFYAGVPIVSPNGITIGSYCILDDVPRNGMDAVSVQFMTDMAMTVMNHLSLVRSWEEHRRGERMIDGLGSFIEGQATLRSLWRDDRAKRVATGPGGDLPEGHPDPRQQGLLNKVERNKTKANDRRDTMIGHFPKPQSTHGLSRLIESKSAEPVNILGEDQNTPKISSVCQMFSITADSS